MRDAEFESAEMRVAAYSELSPGQARALYAGYVKARMRIEAIEAQADGGKGDE